jgi:hypothetical protein
MMEPRVRFGNCLTLHTVGNSRDCTLRVGNRTETAGVSHEPYPCNAAHIARSRSAVQITG